MRINKKNIQQLIEYIDYWIHDRNNPLIDMFVGKQILRLFKTDKICWNITDCAEKYFCIDPYGNIGHCNTDLMTDNYCNINDIENYNDILNNIKYKNLLEKNKRLRDYNCINCIWNDSCNAGCLGMNYAQDSNLTKIDRDYCNFTKLLLPEIYQMIKNIDIERDRNLYNPLFIQLLESNKYYSLDEIFAIEKKYKEEEQN